MSQRSQTIRRAGQAFFALPARSDAQELLDGDQLDRNELAANLRDIRRVNHLLGGTQTTLRYLPELLSGIPRDRTISILDLATGSADIPVAISAWAITAGRPVEIVASDSSEAILAVAREQITGHPAIRLEQYDARDVPLPDRSFDLVLCARSLHHFSPEEAVQVLREMQRLARVGFVLNDLRRSRLGWLSAWIAARLTTRNRLTRNDAPLSVRRAYTPEELGDLLRQAGVESFGIRTHRWFRMAAVYRREGADG